MIIIIHKSFRELSEILKHCPIPTRTGTIDRMSRYNGALFLRILVNSKRALLQFTTIDGNDNIILKEFTFEELMNIPLWLSDEYIRSIQTEHIHQIGGAIFVDIPVIYDDFTTVTSLQPSTTIYDNIITDIEDDGITFEDFIIKYGGRIYLLNIMDYEALDINFEMGVVKSNKKLYFGLYSRAPE